MFEIDTTKKLTYSGNQAMCHNSLWSQYEVQFSVIPQIILKPSIPVQAHYSNQLQKKGKAVPLQAWSGPEGSRKLIKVKDP